MSVLAGLYIICALDFPSAVIDESSSKVISKRAQKASQSSQIRVYNHRSPEIVTLVTAFLLLASTLRQSLPLIHLRNLRRVMSSATYNLPNRDQVGARNGLPVALP